LALGLGTTFCHPTARVDLPTPAPAPDRCALSGADFTQVPDTLVIGVSGAVDPVHAPVPHSDAEQFVFRQLYETLIRLDCTVRCNAVLRIRERKRVRQALDVHLRADAAFSTAWR
jgi:hypothetical protein